MPRRSPPLPASPLLPAAGLRVLDLTRVLAGPVATRTLALLGADVLRIDAPQLPESQDAHNDTGFGKRSAALDLATARTGRPSTNCSPPPMWWSPATGRARWTAFGLTPEALAVRRPGLVVAQVSAWGRYGPWRERRGFDSLVQVATGIAAAEGDAGAPGALPAQALDHGTGYLLAAGVLRALTEQHARRRFAAAAAGARADGALAVRRARSAQAPPLPARRSPVRRREVPRLRGQRARAGCGTPCRRSPSRAARRTGRARRAGWAADAPKWRTTTA